MLLDLDLNVGLLKRVDQLKRPHGRILVLLPLYTDRMNTTRLNDLDELVQSVRDRFSQTYILEAINAYRGGAYRSAIVSTWIAVTYDILAKITELANQGDKKATTYIEKQRQAVKEYNLDSLKAVGLKKLQAIENELLDKAKQDFEFINAQEYVDLSRLKDDRNLCAHPAFADENTLFQPTPDLVRVHIVHAVVHLLQRVPIQGNTLISQITNAISRPSFPSASEDAAKALRDYLDRAKEPVIRKLISILAKAVLRGDVPEALGHERAVRIAIVAISRIRETLYKEQMKETLAEVAPFLNDDRLSSLFALIGVDNRCWFWLDDLTKIRLKTIIGKYDVFDLITTNVFDALSIDDLRPSLISAFTKLDDAEKQTIITTNPRAEFGEDTVQLYTKAHSFRAAGQLGENVLLPMIGYLSPQQIIAVIQSVSDNLQIGHASETPPILDEIFDRTMGHLSQTRDAWQKLINYWAERQRGLGADYSGLIRKLRSHSIDPSVTVQNEEVKTIYGLT